MPRPEGGAGSGGGRRSHISPLTVNRLSIYLRCLQDLDARGVSRVSSTELADRYHLSASQIRKDLAQFGEFGIRGVGYQVTELEDRLRRELGLHRSYGVVIVGIGNLGSALARYPGLDSQGFRVVGLFDDDPRKIGQRLLRHTIRPVHEVRAVVQESGAEIGVLTVPAAAAQEVYDRLVAAGVRAVLNFAAPPLRLDPRVRVKNVDFRIHLEELAFYL